jgi:hypothetical protein
MARSSIAPRRRSWPAAGLLAVGSLMVGCTTLQHLHHCDRAADPECGPWGAQVGGDVLLRLLADGEAPVVVALRTPPGVDEATIAAIGRAQERVLAALAATDYRNRQRFRAVPALAGTIYTARGLVNLLRHPDVRRIDVDLGGGGH